MTTRFTAADYRLAATYAMHEGHSEDGTVVLQYYQAAEQAERLENALVRTQELELMVSSLLQERKSWQKQAEQIAQIRAWAQRNNTRLVIGDSNEFAKRELLAILDAAGEKND